MVRNAKSRKSTFRNGSSEIFVRFVLPRMNQDTGVKDGVFSVAYALRREGNLPGDEYTELDSLLDWFGDSLSVPSRFNRTKSKGYLRRNTKGISWLKSSARKHVSQMHRLAKILKKHGHHVTMIKTHRPGFVVYEDSHQIVAEPFRDLRY